LKEQLAFIQLLIINHIRQRRSIIFIEHVEEFDSGEHFNITRHNCLLTKKYLDEATSRNNFATAETAAHSSRSRRIKAIKSAACTPEFAAHQKMKTPVMPFYEKAWPESFTADG
jgi:hypothetical protein